jgi:EAL domain-containing protein (putative c-di-GMP-specific phosphodiesterase class I)/GGDEF domain-containing protein
MRLRLPPATLTTLRALDARAQAFVRDVSGRLSPVALETFNALYARRPRFQRLATKLTVLYAGLFGLALALLSVCVYTAATEHAQRQVRGELAAGAAVFERLRMFQAEQLRDGARVLARDFGFRQAIATHDRPTVQSALENLRTRLDIDLALLVGVDGSVTSSNARSLGESEQALRDALNENDDADGILFIARTPYRVVAAPVLSPTLTGWVVFATRQDAKALESIQELSAIAFDAQLWRRNIDSAWTRVVDGHQVRGAAARFFDTGSESPGIINIGNGDALAVAKPLQALNSSQPVILVLAYPLARAMAPYQPLFLTLGLLGLVGMGLAVFGSWFIARGVTRPILELADAARRVEHGEDASVCVAAQDEIGRLADGFNRMAAEIRQRQARSNYLALHDAATDLPNRLSTERHVAELITTSRKMVVVAALRVDRFEHVRSAIGYEMAGALIGEVGARLVRLNGVTFVSRLAADMLGLVFEADTLEEARAMALRTQTALEAPLELDEHRIDISLTSGIAAYPDHARDVRTLIERASIALDQARTARKKSAAFDEAAYGDPAANLSLMSDMLAALKTGDMALHYQPKYDLKRQCVVGLEALVRWTHPRRGKIPPDAFISMAEETGHIRALTEWALRRAILDQASLAAAGHALTMSVNISARLLGDPDFARFAIDMTRRAQGVMCFEITETAVIDNPEIALKIIDDFVEAGILISIDDYGSGLSSLEYLKKIRADELKIDKSFVLAMSGSQRDTLLVRSTIDLAHSLGLRVTAEGVEDETALSLLTGIGCDIVQGYLLARPMSLGDAFTFLKGESRQAMG